MTDGWRRIAVRLRLGRRRRSVGFTLLEVLVAFVIVGLTLAALVSTFETGLAGIDRAEKHAVALMLAESKLAEIGVTAPLQAGRQEGSFSTYHWRTTVAPLPNANNANTTVIESYRVDVEVTEAGGVVPGRPLVHLKTVRLAVKPRTGPRTGQ